MPRTDWASRYRRILLQFVIVVALCGLLATARDEASQADAASNVILNSPKFAGAFVNWGPVGRERLLEGWEEWLKQKPSSVLGVDFYAQTTWDDFYRLSWVPGVWQNLNQGRNVVWSMPLSVKGTRLADVADGLHDAEFEAAARAIAKAQPAAIIRLGWEMNLTSTSWYAKGQETDFIKAFRRVVGIFRQYSSEFKFDWCPGWGPQDLAADLTYPGDDVVDYIGLDVYDFKYEGTAAERWKKHYLEAPFGLEWQRDFAAKHGKRMSYPEWGVGQFGDNPYFVQQMYDWFAENEDNIAYAAYFDVDGLWPTQIDNNRFPNSQRLFRKLFTRRS